MDNNHIKETDQKYSKEEKEILHAINRKMLDEGAITEEVYLKLRL